MSESQAGEDGFNMVPGRTQVPVAWHVVDCRKPETGVYLSNAKLKSTPVSRSPETTRTPQRRDSS